MQPCTHTHTCMHTHTHTYIPLYSLQDTFDHLKRAKDEQTASWLDIIDDECNKDAILAIVGNKVDMEDHQMVLTFHY